MANAQDLIEAQRAVELGKIPLWYGDSTKDAFTAEQWIERIENCRTTAQWNDQSTIGYMYAALRGRAIHWYTNAKFRRVEVARWTAIKEDFLKVYAPSKTIRSTVANLEVKQGATETVCDYASRVTIIVSDLYSIIEPYNHPANDQLFGAQISVMDTVTTLSVDDRRAAHDAIRLIGEDRVVQLIAVNLFVAGLKPYLRQKMVVRRYHTFATAFDAAMNFEIQLSEPKKNAIVLAVNQDENEEQGPSEDDGSGDDDEEGLVAEINKLSARLSKTRVKKGKSKSKPKSGTGHQAGGAVGFNVCRYCKQPGHLQYVCPKRKADRAPLVGPEGKPYKRRVQEITQVNPSQSNPFVKEGPPPYQAAQEVAGIWQAPLNWY